MTAKYLLVDDRRDWKTIEAIGERFPQFNVVPPLALVVEPVYPIYACAFVIASQ